MLRRTLHTIRKMSSVSNVEAASAAAAQAATPAPAPKKEKKPVKYELKVPKGTKDWADKDMVVREAVFDTLARVFKRHGAVTIDTPVFELREILAGKYGEDSKLIYNLEDQGGELTSLRYDLTVPFARFVAQNGIQAIKRYHIAKVYRRDQPAMTKGRMREFYQCDFDVAGVYPTMIPDAECLAIAVEGLTSLGITNFTIKLNHRKVLDGIFQVCGVKEEDVRKVSSAVDKLDKLSWEEVKKEMCVEKAQPEEVANRIGEYVQHKGSVKEMLEWLESDATLMANESAKTGIEEMRTALPFLESFGITNYLSFDMSLARGLDYYTGIIYEAVTEASAPPTEEQKAALKEKDGKKKKKSKDDDDNSDNVGVGSILAGGRYDNLVGMFANNSRKGNIPCVGVSFGVERLFSLIKNRPGLMDKVRPAATQVYVMSMGGGPEYTGFLPERMEVTQKLWAAGIEAEYMYKTKPKYPQQFTAAEKAGCPFAVILGQDEYPQGVVKIKELGLGEESDRGTDVKIEDLAAILKEKIANKTSAVGEVQKLLQEFTI